MISKSTYRSFNLNLHILFIFIPFPSLGLDVGDTLLEVLGEEL